MAILGDFKYTWFYNRMGFNFTCSQMILYILFILIFKHTSCAKFINTACTTHILQTQDKVKNCSGISVEWVTQDIHDKSNFAFTSNS